MKRSIIGIIVIVLLFSLVACDEKVNNNENNLISGDNVETENENTENIMSGEFLNNEVNEKEKQMLGDLEINFELKDENKIEENYEYTSSYGEISKFKKVINYSFENKFSDDITEIIYLGQLEEYDEFNENTIHFLEYNNQIIEVFLEDWGENRKNTWKTHVSIVDLNENDKYKEIAIWEFTDPVEYSEIEFYRIIDGKLISMGKMIRDGFYKKDNKLYNRFSDIFWIEEEVITNYYEIKDNKIVHIYKFSDGRNSLTTEDQEADFSEISKNEYTISYDYPIINPDSWNEDKRDYEEQIENGEKVRILELGDWFTAYAKIEKENGEIITISERRAGLT